MKVSVSDIIDSPGRSLVLDQEEKMEIEDLQLLSAVRVAFKLISTGAGGIAVSGTIKTQVEMVCSRCANTYAQNLDIDVDELFLPKDSPELNGDDEGGQEVEAGSLCVFAYDGDELDLDEVLRQNILASLPFCPLCKEDCQGVCAGCGVDLNTGVCTCSQEKEIDPRWNALKKFMQDKP